MDRLKNYRNIIRTVLAQHLEWSRSRDIDETIAICDEKTDNYLLMSIGWNGDRRIHGILAHLRIIDDRIYIEQNKVSWQDAIEFCARLSIYTGRAYGLPSEAQWEYTCRARTTTPFHFGETLTTEIANYDGNYTYGKGPKGKYRRETTVGGHFGVSNEFGLYDMHGNVWEWCADPWHDNYEGAPEDGSVWDEEENDNRYHNHSDYLVKLFYRY